jgi:hypothetical protein
LLNENDTTDENYQVRLNSGDLLIQTQTDARTGAATKVTIDSSGNVGIGLSSNLSGLCVNNTIRSQNGSSNVSYIGFTGYTGTSAAGGMFSYMGGDGRSTGYLTFNTNDTERLRIDSSGKVGIGETSMDALLVIKGNSDANTTPSIRLKDGTDTREAWITNTSGDLVLANGGNDNVPHCVLKMMDGNFITFSTANTEQMRLDSSGRLLIAATSSYAASNADDLQVGDNTSSAQSGITLGSTVASSIRWRDGADAGIISYIHSDNSMRFSTDDSERLRIDGSGRLLVGTSTSSGYTAARLIVNGAGSDATASGNLVLQRGEANGSISNGDQIGTINFGDESGYSYATITADADLAPGSDSPGRLVFSTTADGASSPTERMRILSGGDVLINRTTAEASGSSLQVIGTPAASFEIGINGNNVVEFRKSGGANVVGSISISNAGTTAYNTSSDYRLKENVVDIADGITRVKQLQPKRFNFIADAETTVDGFLAHEAQTVVPEAVTGTHNEVDDDGNAVMQGIDQSKLVPLLTAALQEAIAKIETLETKVAALEAG